MLGSLKFLKEQLLAEALRVDTAYDDALQTIGAGVAGQFEKFCNRKFARVENDTATCSADRDHFYLPRYPFETISEVAKQSDAASGFVALTSAIQNTDPQTGLVFFNSRQGQWWETLRFTYTGGYWFDTSEDESGEMPAGATALPDDLRLAWVLQCKEVWNHNDKLGLGLAGTDPAKKPSFAPLELISSVKEILNAYRRFQIT